MEVLDVLENRDEIKKAQETLRSELEKIKYEKVPKTIVTKGGVTDGDVCYSKEHNIWFALYDEVSTGAERCWNAFGLLDKPMKDSIVPLVEINPPYEINRRVAGVFAKNDKGNIFLLHRGRIGGGKKGIGLKLFYENYEGETSPIREHGKISDREIANIGCITSDDFPVKLKKFIENVGKMKRKIYNLP